MSTRATQLLRNMHITEVRGRTRMPKLDAVGFAEALDTFVNGTLEPLLKQGDRLVKSGEFGAEGVSHIRKAWAGYHLLDEAADDVMDIAGLGD